MGEAAVLPSNKETMFSNPVRKRKTPSELRLEQLKRVQNDQDQSVASSGRFMAQKKQEAAKSARFIDTRVPDIYAATKPGDRSNRVLVKDKKDVPFFPQKFGQEENEDTVVPDCNKSSERDKVGLHNGDIGDSSNVSSASGTLNQRTSFSTFRDVIQISSSVQGSSSGLAVDMVKALKGMSAPKASYLNDQPAELQRQQRSWSNSAGQFTTPSTCLQEDKYPLDLSLKTAIRFTSNSSFARFQRITNKDVFTGMQSFLGSTVRGHKCCCKEATNSMTEYQIGMCFVEALHSWVHPQSALPSLVLSALASSAAHGGTAEKEFLSRRQQLWEDSFRSLYYLFRNGQCDLFYLSTQQFYAMFIGGGIKGDKKACSAYITRSTRGLRTLLQEQDITFSMPLCLTKVDTTIEDIQELTEFEKSNPGQTRLVDSMVAVDSSSQSMLEFTGHRNVHGLYDFLLNHRCLLSSTTGQDIPVLYSPISFQNASLVTPEVVCKQLQRSSENELYEATDMRYVIDRNFMLELKGSTLPPWVVWRVSAVMQKFHSGNVEASLMTDPLSGCLNMAQDFDLADKAKQEKRNFEVSFQDEWRSLTVTSRMRAGYVKHFKLVEGSFVVDLCSV